MHERPISNSDSKKPKLSRYWFIVLLVCSLGGGISAGQAGDIILSNEYWSIRISPGTLQTRAELPGGGDILLSAGQADLGPAGDIIQEASESRWLLESKAVRVNVRLNGRDLSVRFSGDKTGEFTWPVLQEMDNAKALIWPRWEGCYIPLDDRRWQNYLIETETCDTLEGLSMPFWGMDYGDFSLTYIITNPYNNEIKFQQSGDRLGFQFTHEFTSLTAVKEFGFLIHLSENDSPVEPAMQFRKWLFEQGKFVGMEEKARKVPNATRLLGAAHVYLWGDGVSVKMLDRFREDGFDRLRLCLEGWEEIEKRPEVAEYANRMGYLFGTYDSYHSIHDPALRGTEDTWITAQFDRELYEKGPVVRKDGKKRGGFKGTGFKLSPIAARPYVEKRVRENMNNVPYSYYFVDCDAYGEVYDDYSPFHRASQADDVAARLDRMAWISDTFGVVVGSEGGSSYAAPVIHVAEGMFGPAFGWGDSDLTNKDSKYYLGQYYPPGGPKVFVKQVPMKERYQYFYYDPRFRLPLYEIVFHDSVVTTHQWANSSLKYNNMLDTVSLTELLYMVPPLYHMNLDEFDKHREIMKMHYAFFSPLHRRIGFARMKDFKWLSGDRMLQRTVFDNGTEIVANFSKESRRYRDIDIPGRSILAKWTDKGEMKTSIFTPVATE